MSGSAKLDERLEVAAQVLIAFRGIEWIRT